MTTSRGSKFHRQQAIFDHIMSNGTATSAEIAELTDVSLMTTHRDIEELAARGLLRKFHGGISALPSTVFESSSEFRMRSNTRAKEAIGAAALALIEPGMSIMLDDSTTAFALAGMLGEVGPLTVVSNYMPTLERLKGVADIHLIAIGGDYSPSHDSFLGVAAVEAVSSLNVDVVFVSTSAMTSDMTFHQEQGIIQVKKPMLSAGARKVLLMDRAKLGKTALYRLAPLQEYTDILLEADERDDTVQTIMDTHAHVTLVHAD